MRKSIRLATRCALASTGLLLGCAGSSPVTPPDGTHASGVVFHDRNGNGVQDRFDFGIAGVGVSNGRDVVRTDRHGRYRLPVSDDTIVFVIKPSGFAVPVDDLGIPRFYYIHKPAGSPDGLFFPGVEPTGPLPASIDFPLRRRAESDAFDVLLFADSQPYTQEQLDWLAHDVIEEVIGIDAAFGISLGDLVGDDLALFEPLNRTMGLVGIPWHFVLGNHDLNYRAQSDVYADETFERVYGPATYAFDYGPAHFIVLDDVVYGGADATGEFSIRNYTGGLTPDQLRFVEGYLADVPRDELVVLAMHIPLEGNSDSLRVAQNRELLAALSTHPHTFSIAGHTHTQHQEFFGADAGFEGPEPHHQLVQGTTSGSWWLGERDELDIPHATMRDGTPNGYGILHVDGSSFAVRYKAARRPANYQMHIFAPEAVARADAPEAEVLVNFFSGSERSRVEMRLGPAGAWIPMERVERPDPYFILLKRRDLEANPGTPTLPVADPSRHVWSALLPPDAPLGTFAIEVRATDDYGTTFVAHRVIRIE